jgi:hypothetical protein
MIKISVLVPSRFRLNALLASLVSLRDTATAPGSVEYLVAADPDDPVTVSGAWSWGARVWEAPERYGYNQLHLYWNALAKLAAGDWLMLWNDDCRMLADGWDKPIEAERPGVLWPYTNGHLALGNPFPAWPASWSRLLGYVSPVMHPDTYLQGLGFALGCSRRVRIEVNHLRPDLTGAEPDATYREGRALLGPDGMVPGWDRDAVGAMVAADARRIREAGLA